MVVFFGDVSCLSFSDDCGVCVKMLNSSKLCVCV